METQEKKGWMEENRMRHKVSKSIRTLFGWTALSEETFSSVPSLLTLFLGITLHLFTEHMVYLLFPLNIRPSLSLFLSQVSPPELLIF